MREAKLFFTPGTEGPVAVPPQEVNVRVVRLDASIDSIVPPNAKLFKLAEGFQFTEGPVWDRAGNDLLFSDPNANRIYAYSEVTSSLSVFRDKSGYEGTDIVEYGQPGSNGLTFDSRGRLTINQHGNRRVIRIEDDGALTVLADRFDGKRLNSPNDLVYKKDGSVYFTDPPFGLPKFFDDARKELPFSGVYRARNGKVSLLTRELSGPNGIAFSPDEKYLYIGNWDPNRKVVLRFLVLRDGSLGTSEIFADMTQEIPGDEAIDGLKVDVRGNLYVSAPDGVRIYSAEGQHLGTIIAPRDVHNFAWGGTDGRTLYLAGHDRLYRMSLWLKEYVRERAAQSDAKPTCAAVSRHSEGRSHELRRCELTRVAGHEWVGWICLGHPRRTQHTSLPRFADSGTATAGRTHGHGGQTRCDRDLSRSSLRARNQ
jgi:gluconolactonase